MTSMSTQGLIDEITRRVLVKLNGQEDPYKIVVGVSNKHVHLSEKDLQTLFGIDRLTVFREVRQPQEFAAEQTVTVHGPRTSFTNVRVMGPCRPKTQVELSRTDCYALGIAAPITQSGHLDEAGPVEIEGPVGRITCEHAAIVAARHIHMGPSHATQLGVADQDLVKVMFGGQRGGVMENFIIRIKDNWVPEIHLDTDEANALHVKSGDFGELITQ